MAIGEGRKSYIQFGQEAAWGTGVAATDRLEVISIDVGPEQGIILDPSLNNSVGRRGVFQGGTLYRGTFVVRMNYSGLEKLFSCLLGVAGTSTIDGAGPAYDHLLHDGMAQETVKSLTIELIEGDIEPGLCQRLLGCTFTSCTIRGTAGQGQDAMLTAEFEVLAKDKVVGFTPTGALVAPAVNPILFHHGTTMDNGVVASNLLMRTIEVRYEAPHASDLFFFGSRNPAEFIRDDFVKATYRFTEALQTTDVLEALQQFTNATPRMLFTAGTLAPSGTYEFEIKSEKGTVSRASHPVSGYGTIYLESTVEAYHDPTLGTCWMNFRNEKTAI